MKKAHHQTQDTGPQGPPLTLALATKQTRSPVSRRKLRQAFESKLARMFAQEVRAELWPHMAAARRQTMDVVGAIARRVNQSGKSWPQIANEFGLPTVTLWRWARRNQPTPARKPAKRRFAAIRSPDTPRASKSRIEERHETAGGPGAGGAA